MTTQISDEDIVRQVVDRLHSKHLDVPRSKIELVARREFLALADSPVKDFLSILTERAARQQLGAANLHEPTAPTSAVREYA